MSYPTRAYHMYSKNGFESAHRTEASAVRAAKGGARRSGKECRVYRCSAYGFTGDGHGTLIFTALPQMRK